MRVRTAAARALAAVAPAVILVGCGANQQSLVKSKVEEFAQATKTHDYLEICNDVLAPTLLADLVEGGIGCEQAMQVAFSRLHDPRLVIGNIDVHGGAATALTISQATGEKTVLATLELVKTAKGWRISSLGGA